MLWYKLATEPRTDGSEESVSTNRTASTGRPFRGKHLRKKSGEFLIPEQQWMDFKRLLEQQLQLSLFFPWPSPCWPGWSLEVKKDLMAVTVMARREMVKTIPTRPLIQMIWLKPSSSEEDSSPILFWSVSENVKLDNLIEFRVPFYQTCLYKPRPVLKSRN